MNRTGIQQQQLRKGQHQKPLVTNEKQNEPSKLSIVEQSQNLRHAQVSTRTIKKYKSHIRRISRATSPFDFSRTRAGNTHQNASKKIPALIDTFISKCCENDDCHSIINRSSSNGNTEIKTSCKTVKPFVASLIAENILDILLNELVLEFSMVMGDLQRVLVDTI